MGEGDCVTVIDGVHAGKTGVITLIDGRDIFVDVEENEPLILRRGDLKQVECEDE